MKGIRQIPPGPVGEAHCVHCLALLGEEHGLGCVYGGPPLLEDQLRTGVSNSVLQSHCEGRAEVHTNASLGLLKAGKKKASKRGKPRKAGES
jgi:hypothetical protein